MKLINTIVIHVVYNHFHLHVSFSHIINFIHIQNSLVTLIVSICIISSMNTISFHHKVYSCLFISSTAYVMNFIYEPQYNSLTSTIQCVDHFIQMTWFFVNVLTQEYSFISAIAFLWPLSICKQGFIHLVSLHS
jgi:hypothetical protein